MSITTNDFDMILRQDLSSFIHRCFQHLDPHTPFASNWHLDLLSDRLRQVFEGKIKRLIINVPPRSLKSISASVAFPAWVLGLNPSQRIICASYGQDLSNKMARDCLSIMQSPWYCRAFPTEISQRSATADFETTARGGRLATSVGGVLTGRGGDIIIIDDPVKPDEAMSDTSRQNANDWYDNTLYTRLNNKREGAIILIMQRLHLDDMVGHVLEKEPWTVVSLPAIATEREEWTYRTLSGTKTKIRQPDELLHESREGKSELDAVQQNVGSYVFSAQYLQNPVPMGGGLIKEEWLHYYEEFELPENFELILQSWDTANKESELADYCVCTTWGIAKDKTYLLHVLRRRMEYPELKRKVKEHRAIWKAQKVLIEDKASGTQLIQELKQGDMPEVEAFKPEGDKLMRMNAQTAVIENGKVRFPKNSPWLASFVTELTSFPKSKFKDQVDSTSQALCWMANNSVRPTILEYYKMLYEKQKSGR